MSRIALQGSQQRAPPTPDRAGVRRGSRFSGPLAKRQISEIVGGISSRWGRAKRRDTYLHYRTKVTPKLANQGPRHGEERGKEEQVHI